jgi:hypothetical protein
MTLGFLLGVLYRKSSPLMWLSLLYTFRVQELYLFLFNVLMKIRRECRKMIFFFFYISPPFIHSHMLVCDWMHSVRQNHFYVMLLFNQGYCYESTLRLRASRRLYTKFKIVEFRSLAYVQTTWYSIRTLISQATFVWTTRSFYPNSH